jgi:hypothetical protein
MAEKLKFTESEIERAKAGMSKPGPRDALALVGSGRALFKMDGIGKEPMITHLDGQRLVDPEFPEREGMYLAGAWALLPAGMIDEFCCLTPAGRRALEAQNG